MPQLAERFSQSIAGVLSPINVGLSEESEKLLRDSIENLGHYYFPVSRETLAQKFQALADIWREETAHLSSVTQTAMHPAYQQIIGMGPSVLPLILQKLENELEHWFWALKAITGIDPVEPSDRGKLTKMAEAWIRWGKEQGYI